LWHVQLGAAIYSTAVTFEAAGKQYVLIPSGSALFAFALPGPSHSNERSFAFALWQLILTAANKKGEPVLRGSPCSLPYLGSN